ncbi:MAG: flagellar basal body L-ring protein FlgH [Planctomycetia bacterium]|nr:flagellar basal body L-ring protein FlgH [Planctomycetia bacterium]
MIYRVMSIVALSMFAVLGGGKVAQAQRASLYQQQVAGRPLTLEGNSWLYVQMPPAREIQVNDLITVLVKQKQQSQSEGQVNRIQQSGIDARLRDWVQLDGLGIKLAPQTAGDPRARASLDSTLRTNAELETASFIQFNITATVVDIRPNGNLVLEAHGSVKDNNEVWEASLSGIVRRQDVQPDNTVFSEKIAELSVHKRETGHIRDAYKRGWALRAYDAFKPF